MPNPLLDDRGLDFVLHDVLDAASLSRLPHFADHGRETFDAWIGICRRFARDVLYPAYRLMDEAPPVLRGGQVFVHPRMKEIWPRLCELGVIAAARPAEAGGQQLPATIALAEKSKPRSPATDGAFPLIESQGHSLHGAPWQPVETLSFSTLNGIDAIPAPAFDLPIKSGVGTIGACGEVKGK
jgi:alkylation response protein AidB-like acyl-CoA dehydrogenase